MTLLSKLSKKQAYNWQFSALGTVWNIETQHALLPAIRAVILTRIEQFDRTYSRFRIDSLAQQLRTPGEYVFPADSTKLFKVYEKLHTLTDGHMTPLIGGLLEDMGYDAAYTFKPVATRDTPDFARLGWDGKTTLRPSESIVLDVGAVGKGYLVDIIAELLDLNGIDEYTVDASGDMRHKGKKTIRVGLEHPVDATKVIGVATVNNMSMCASATNRRKWRGMHHVLNPVSKQPTDSMLATWVIAREARIADALATALFFVPPDVLESHFDFSWVKINTEGSIDASPRFKGELFI